MPYLMLILILTSQAMSMEVRRLDTLLHQSEELEQKGIRGFIYQQQQQKQYKLKPPEELFDSSEEIVNELPVANLPSSAPSQYVTFREYMEDVRLLEGRIVELEGELKTMVGILENIHGYSKNTIETVNFMTKIGEIITALITLLTFFGLGKSVYNRRRPKSHSG